MSDPEEMAGWPEEWEAVALQIASDRGTALILGAADTGKSTLTQFLVRRWCESGLKVALVDGDVGQSTIGLPTTVGVALFQSPPEDISAAQPDSFRFIGSTSPHGHILDLIASLRRMVDKAFELEAEITLVDTTGMVFGRAAHQLKFYKIALLAPKYILALERSDEIEHLLSPYSKGRKVIYRLPIADNIRGKSRERRRDFRERKFREYFEGSQIEEFSIEELAFWGHPLGSGTKLGSNDMSFLSKALDTHVIYGEKSSDGIFIVSGGDPSEEGIFQIRGHFGGEISVLPIDHLSNLLVGLNDGEGETLALGIIKDINFKKNRISVYTPWRCPSRIKMIQFGSVRLDSSGRELGKIPKHHELL